VLFLLFREKSTINTTRKNLSQDGVCYIMIKIFYIISIMFSSLYTLVASVKSRHCVNTPASSENLLAGARACCLPFSLEGVSTLNSCVPAFWFDLLSIIAYSICNRDGESLEVPLNPLGLTIPQLLSYLFYWMI
jgi:hypothetical protein